MKKTSSILTVTFLVLNVILNPIMTISSVYAEEGEAFESNVLSSEVISEEVSQEPVVDEPIEPPSSQVEEPVESELPTEETGEPQEEVIEESSEESGEEESEEEEEKEPVTSIGFEAATVDHINTGSEIEVPVRVTNSEAALEGALLRFTIDGTNISDYETNSAYFPYADQAASNVYYNGSSLIIEYNLNTLSEEYNRVTTLSLNTVDDGSMRHGTQIPVMAEVIQNGHSVAQTSYRNYNFVTRQPHFTTTVSYPEEASTSDDDEEGPTQSTEIAYSFSFDNNGSGNGSGQSAVTNLTVSTTVPETLTFEASLNNGWTYDEASRIAYYSVAPESYIYTDGFNLPANLMLTASEVSEDVQASVYAEAIFTFTNGDVVTKTNQPEVMMTASEAEIAPLAAVTENLVTSFALSYTTNSGDTSVINNGDHIEVNLDDMNAVLIDYGLVRPDNMVIGEGDTYSLPLPPIAHGITVSNRPIMIDGTQVATYSIVGNEIVITFNEAVNDYDDVEMHVNISGSFNTEVFEATEEVVVEVPYRDEGSFTATIRPEQQEYEGVDRKDAGNPYILNEDGSKNSVDRNPTHVDWTVRVNDSAGSFDNATIIDDLGANLEIVPGSFVIEKILRNYNNVEIGRESVTGVTPVLTENGFELPLGAIEDAYSITYTTMLTRPDGGGTLSINNNARIVLDGAETSVNDSFEGTWSGDLPTITKDGNLVSGQSDRIEWQVEYNYSKESLGTVTLSDVLSDGEVIADTIQVYQVDTDIDGNIIDGTQQEITVAPVIDGSNFSIPDLDADGIAYYITFQSSVPVGLNNTVINTISDNLNPQNSDDASVPVNTIPSGGKVGEQYVDESGNPYIEWTITMNSEQLDVPSIEIRDVFDSEYLSFDPNDGSLFELYQDGVAASNFTIEDYTHTDGRTGFYLNIGEAGPHTYQFVYRTYYTVAGMQQPNLANNAELVFLDSEGVGIGETIVADVSQTGPSAGIRKSGEYVYAEENPTVAPQIRWTVVFNESKTLLNNPTLTDTFTSNNYSYIDGSVQVQANGAEFTNYDFNASSEGFVLQLNEASNATFIVTFLTTVDMDANENQTNNALLTWQGGEESADATVGQRQPGIYKQAEVTINEDGSKSIDWVVGFNETRQVLHDVTVEDVYSPSTATVSNVKLFRDGAEVAAGGYSVSNPENGRFTVDIGHLDPVPYRIIYTTTLSPEEELSQVENLATISYTGGSESAHRTIPSPTLGVSKEATGLNKEAERPIISWQINANTDTANHNVNLVNAVLTDTIPGDQALIQDSIVVTREDGTNVTDSVTIDTDTNNFTIGSLNGPYQYIVTFNTEILEYPSFHPSDTDRYTNSTTLTNTGYDPVSDDAYQDYFYDGGNNGPVKSGEQNPETENIDWTVDLNQQELTINNFEVRDTLTGFHSYLPETFVVTNAAGTLAEDAYTLSMSAENRRFTLTIGDGTINESYQLSYSTRLDPDKVGSYDVTNSVEIHGGATQRFIDRWQETTTAQQWFYGGGGSGTSVSFELLKQHRTGYPIEDVNFNLRRVNVDGSQTDVIGDVSTDSNGIILSGNIRAGRYILQEQSTPNHYQVLQNPIYFTIGYAPESTSEFVVTLTDSNWNASDHSHATASGNNITVENDLVTTSVTAMKRWDEVAPQGVPLMSTIQATNYPTTWFQLYRYTPSTYEEEVVPETEIKQLGSNSQVEEVTWDNIEQYTPAGEEYIFFVKEVDAEGNDYTPEGYYKTEEGLTVYNTKIEDPVITATKQLIGRNQLAGEFEFILTNIDTGDVTLATNNAQGIIEFTNFLNEAQQAELTRFGSTTGSYSISESTENPVGGVTYDDATYRIEMIMYLDSETGSIHAEYLYRDGTPIFRNTYEYGPSNIVLEAQKTLENKDIQAEQFSFELVDSTGTVIQTQTNDATGRVIFDNMAFEEPGTYYYEVREIQGNDGGITYDSTVYDVAIDVIDNTQGELIATARYINGPLSFTNTYQTAPDNVVLEASKILEGSQLVADQFSFELVDSEGTVLQTKTNNADGSVIFEEIHYDTVGEFDYTIREVAGNLGGVTYDATHYPVHVSVTDDGAGQLVATESYINGIAVFTNNYTTESGSVVLEAIKTLEGQVLRDEQFSFELRDSAGELIELATNNVNGQVIFSEISYTEVGDYTYTIRETEGVQGGVTYDGSVYTINVSVIDNGEGQLVAQATYVDGPAHFTNTYETDSDSVAFQASKVLEGQPLRNGQFTFELVDGADAIIQRVTNNAEGQVIFNDIQYTEVGDHTYIIREAQGSQGGVTYDETEYVVNVSVTDNGEGQLTATVDYTDGPAVFTNIYATTPDSVVFEASKTLVGQSLVANQFSFELVDADGTVIETVSNNANGQVIFSEINYDEAGSHTYTIREVEGVQGGVIYDAIEHVVNVIVSDNGEGMLTATVDYVDGPAHFTNTYATTSDSVVIEASKVLTGQPLRANQFTFELVDASDAIIQRVTNNAQGQIIFNEIYYTEAGEHNYIIREVQGSQGGVTYDATEFGANVVVTDNGEGQLTAELSYSADDVVFNNVYDTGMSNAVIEAAKVLEGQNLVDGRFDFNLLDEEETILQTVSNNGQGQIIFDTITYEAPGVYTYYIQEINDEQPGITYDENRMAVTVTVTDTGEGQLLSEVSYESTPTFTNTYGTQDVTATITGTKQLVGRNLEAEEFAFTLSNEAGEVIETVSNDAQGNISFSEMTYTEPGTHTYIIDEVESGLGGVTDDQRTYTVVVTVSDNAEGALVANVNYVTGPVLFTNTYGSAPDSVILEAAKILENKELTAEQFSFELRNEQDEVIQTTFNDVFGAVYFDELVYTEPGIYNYTVNEVNDGQGGVTYDETVYNIVVEVVDNGEGQLIATESYGQGPATFTNTYESAPDTIVLEASKTLTGQALRDNQFEFDLVDAEGTIIETVSNNANGQVIFSEINYTEVGEYAYTIREVEGVQGGVTYDISQFAVTVTVTDNGEGQLVAQAAYVDGPANFINTYATTPENVVFEASKILEGQPLRNDQFTFELVDEADAIIQRVTNNAEGQVIFNEINYTEVGEYTYTIREVQGSQGGVTYDTAEYTVTVSVTDDTEGQLVAEVVYPNGPAQFSNAYETSPDNVIIQANKALNGKTLVNNQFEFELVDAEGQVLQTVSNNQMGQIIFDEIHYDTVGNHTYTVREVLGNQGGMSYDTNTFEVNVSVTDDGEGQLVATATYPDGPVNFTNVYTTAPDSVVLEASKVLNGQEQRDGQFQFELLDESGEVIQTVNNNASGQVIFDEIHYNEAGKHTYLIREVQTGQGGMTYDSRVRTVTVTVSDNGDGQLVTTVNHIGGPAVFTNTYEADPANIVIEASKVLTGQTLVDNQFTFELLNEADDVIQTVTNNSSGQVIFEEMAYDTVGEYHYTIREQAGAQRGMTYDSTEFEVLVEVVDGREGQLIATAIYNGHATFENTYEPLATQAVVEVDKVLTGRALQSDEFTFELLDEEGDVIATATNDASGNVYFDSMVYDEVGTYNYQIREITGLDDNITYDEAIIDVTVEVIDEEGQLIATPSYDFEAVFTNTYTPHAGEVVLEADKELTGRDLLANEFVFEVRDNDGNVITTGTNDSQGNVYFGSIVYTEVGTHDYTIHEVAGLNDTITYDETTYGITVEVTDNEGQLVATPSYSNTPVFTNLYTPHAGEVRLEADKELIGRALNADEFSFELVDSEGNIISTASNDSEGNIFFEALAYTEVGSFNYIIREAIGDNDTITYDESIFEVTVDVVDESGQLIATPSYSGATLFTNTYTPYPGELVLEADKALIGRALNADEFTFELVDSEGTVISTSTNDGQGNIYFEAISYDEVGSYNYNVREVAGEDENIMYDESIFDITVDVTDEEGQLIATPSYTESVLFTNTYTPNPGELVLEADKALIGRSLNADEFTFELVDSEGTVIATTTNDSEGNIYFDAMSYDQVGSHTYTIREVTGFDNTITYDDTMIEVTVNVTDQEGQLVATPIYNEVALFTNTYAPQEGDIVLEADKKLIGRALNADEFTFELVDSDGQVIETATNDASGKVYFNAITYSEGGIYNYTIREVAGMSTRVTYDDSVFEVTVEVTDEDGQLIATPTYEGDVVFTNIYTPTQGNVVIQVEKVLENRSLTQGEFTFELVDSNGTVVSTATNDAAGNVYFSELNYTEVGTHTYTVREVEETDASVTYDDTVFTVVVDVVDQDGQLTPTVTYDTEEGTMPVFINTATPVGPGNPEEPGEPEEPEEPSEPEEPGNPEQPSKPEEPGKPNKPENPSDSGGESDLPATGEEPDSLLGVYLLIVGLGFLVSVNYLPMRKHKED